MLRQRLSDRYSKDPYYYSTPGKHNLKEEKPNVTDKDLAVYGIILSLLVIVVRFWYANQDAVKKAIFELRLVYLETLSEDNRVMYMHTWKTVVKYSNIVLPVICGIFSSYFTWIMVYLDSNVPGVQPPSPLSPKKYKVQSGHTFHLNYVFAVLVGVFVSSYMYFKGVSIEY